VLPSLPIYSREHHGYEYADCAAASSVAPISAADAITSEQIRKRMEPSLFKDLSAPQYHDFRDVGSKSAKVRRPPKQ